MPKIEAFTVSRNDNIHEGWPDLIRLQSGRMLLTYNECVSHPNRDHTKIILRKSDDDGKTWSDRVQIGPETMAGGQFNSIRFSQLSDGRVILVCDKVGGDETSKDTLLYMWESRDDGDTWTEGRTVGIYGYCSDKVRELPDGSLILAISQQNEVTDKTDIVAYKSYDGGKTWGDRVTVGADPRYTFIEPALTVLSDGTVAAILRENSHKGYGGFVSFSGDCGKTWGQLIEIPLPGMHRPFPGFLRDGRILLSYRERPAGEVPYPDLNGVVFTEDELKDGLTAPGIFNIAHDTSEHPDQGYSAWTELPDGTVYMVNYITNDAPKPYIEGYKIYLDK